MRFKNSEIHAIGFITGVESTREEKKMHMMYKQSLSSSGKLRTRIGTLTIR